NPVFFKKRLTFSALGGILTKSAKFGPVAQLGERSVRIREVKGSNPSRSTRFSRRFACGFFFAIFRQVLPGCVFTLSANQYTIKGKFGNRAFFRFCRQEGEGRLRFLQRLAALGLAAAFCLSLSACQRDAVIEVHSQPATVET